MQTRKWFKEWGWIYLPVSVEGLAITLLFLIFCIQVIFAVDRNSHSASDTLYGIFPFAVPAFLVWLWIGSHTSK